MSLSTDALFAFGQAGLGLDAASANLAHASDPTAPALTVAGGQLAARGGAVDPVADRVTLTSAAIQMAVAAKLLHVEKATQQSLLDVMA